MISKFPREERELGGKGFFFFRSDGRADRPPVTGGMARQLSVTGGRAGQPPVTGGRAGQPSVAGSRTSHQARLTTSN